MQYNLVVVVTFKIRSTKNIYNLIFTLCLIITAIHNYLIKAI